MISQQQTFNSLSHAIIHFFHRLSAVSLKARVAMGIYPPKTKMHSSISLSLILMLLALQSVSYAQKLVPLHQNSQMKIQNEYTSFPFYEDFSNITGLADTSRWEAGSGVYVNSSYGIGAPTLGVATFDGLDASGTPYSFDAPSDLGLADNLTSKKMDLSGFSPSDTPTLTFYWQARGWGEQPNADDSLILEFINNEGEWIRQWGVSADTITAFDQDTVQITQSAYLHENFQFRFINYGRLSGPYDTWNLDYIYFNLPANADKPDAGIVRDFGFSEPPASLLQGYSHVPWVAFQAQNNALSELTAKLTNARSSSIGDNTTHFFSTKIYADDVLVSDETIPASSTNSQGLASNNGTIFLLKGETVDVTAPVSLPLNNISLDATVRIEQQFFLFENAEDLNAVQSKQNDTLTIMTTLGQAFAYDDGSAELGWGVNKKFGRFAIEFETPVDWRVDAVDIHIARVGRRLEQGGFRVGIWQHIDTVDANNDIILSAPKYHAISYTDSINKFERFALESKVTIPAGKFYVVLEQLTDDLLPIGFDVQTNRSEKLFLNLGGSRWSQNNQFEGSLMVRPVQLPSTVTATEKVNPLAGLTIYPNPSEGKVYWDMLVDRVEVLDAVGRSILHQTKPSQQMFDLSGYKQGIYFLKFSKNGSIITKKIIKH